MLGLEKIDLGLEWTHFTKLPFVYAAWTGKRGVLSKQDVELLQLAKTQGIAEIEAIAAEYAAGDPLMAGRASAYLRENVRYELGSNEISGLQLFLDYASDVGYGFGRRTLEFY
jgi:chorismate dehydratase